MSASFNNRTLLVGITGGIGSGKSTLARMLLDKGLPLLQLDTIGHQLLDDAAVCAELIASFGATIRRSDGSIDRAELARLAFADRAATSRLNAIMHPRIWRSALDWMEAQEGPLALIEAAVLIEAGWSRWTDRLIVVRCERKERCRRVVEERGKSEEYFEAVAARQCSESEREYSASEMIDNNGTLAALQARADDLYARLLAWSEQHRKE